MKKKNDLTVTHYRLPFDRDLRLTFVSDVHHADIEPILACVKAERPDVIAFGGDLVNDINTMVEGDSAYGFLQGLSAIAPTVFAFGNHDIGAFHPNVFATPIAKPILPTTRDLIQKTGVVLLDNSECVCNGVRFYGVTSALNGHKKTLPSPAVLQAVADLPKPAVVLCHHPEYIPCFKDIPGLYVLCGHAHGGQWRFFGRGVFAPGQGLFPRYTSGIYHGNCIVSRGVGDETHIPRINNPHEVVTLDFYVNKDEKE